MSMHLNVKGAIMLDYTFYRPTWAEINVNALKHNIKEIKQTLPEDCRIMAVVKANAYGHGMVQVAQTALESGASAIAVALIEEALELRQAGISAPILVLNWVSPKYAHLAAKHQITLTVFQKQWLDELQGETFKQPLRIHLKWDTGMGRIGIKHEDELLAILNALKQNPNIYLTGVYTHFATADEEDLAYFYEQQERFYELLTEFNRNWQEPITIHIGNSAAALRFPHNMHQYIRLGIAMYGLYPSPILKNELNIQLQSVFSLHSRLIHVKKVNKGDYISYGKTYQAQDDEWIGTIPIGYGDGWTRKLQGASVLIQGKRHPIVGRVCMDQTMIKLDRPYEIGEKVTLIGKQGDEVITIDEVAKYIGTINYEVPCMLNQRIPRIYQD